VAILPVAEVAVIHAIRQAARQGKDGAQLPSANDQVFSPVGAGQVLLAFADGQIVAAIRHYLLPPDVAVAHMRDDVVPGIVAGLLAKRAGPLVVHRPRSALLILLLESDLQSIELS